MKYVLVQHLETEISEISITYQLYKHFQISEEKINKLYKKVKSVYQVTVTLRVLEYITFSTNLGDPLEWQGEYFGESDDDGFFRLPSLTESGDLGSLLKSIWTQL